MKILMLSNYYYPHIGGNEGQCKLLSETLKKHNNEITIITKRYKNELSKYEIINGVAVYRIFCLCTIFKAPILKKISLIRKILNRLYFYIDEFTFILIAGLTIIRLRKKIDIIHVHQTHWISFCGVIVSKIIKKPILIKDATLNGFETLKLMPFAKMMKKAIIKTGFFSAITTDIHKNLLLAGVKNNKIFDIPNGVILPKFCNKYEKDNYEILFVGNFNQGKIKGLDILFHSMPLIIKKCPLAKLIVLGNGNPLEFNDFVLSNHLNSNIKILGEKDPAEFYQKCSVFVLPSRNEGMSNSLLEAMSYGMPCISTKVSGSNDLIKHDENGLLVNIESIRKLADQIIYLLTNKNISRILGLNARKTIEESFLIENISQKYIEAYNKLIIKNGK